MGHFPWLWNYGSFHLARNLSWHLHLLHLHSDGHPARYFGMWRERWENVGIWDIYIIILSHIYILLYTYIYICIMILSHIYIWINMILMYGYRYLNIETYKIWLKIYYILFIDILNWYNQSWDTGWTWPIWRPWPFLFSWLTWGLGGCPCHRFATISWICEGMFDWSIVYYGLTMKNDGLLWFYGMNIPSGKLTVRPWHSSGLED